MAKRARIKIGRAVIDAEIADTVPKLALGLMFRRKLAENAGMLLVFPRPGNYSIHMWFVRFPLDVIFIKEDMTVARIHSAKPWEAPFRAGCSVKYALEVSGGLCASEQIKPKVPVMIL